MEIEEVVAALRSGWITTGPRVKLLEKRVAEYVGVNKAVCLNSATAALELTLRILGIGMGDEVITSAYTYSASASVIHHVGAKVVLVDVSPESYEMDYKKVADAITDKTKAIIPIDIAGRMCDYDAIYSVVESQKHLFSPSSLMQENIGRITVISDAAHALGATRKGKNAGTVADFTCFSLHEGKFYTGHYGAKIA